MPLDEVQTVAAVHDHNLAMVSCFSFFMLKYYNRYCLLIDYGLLCYFQLGHSGKELYDLYRYFQGAYFSEVEGHKATKAQLVTKGEELVTVSNECNKLHTAKNDLDKVKKNLQLAETLNQANTLALKNKDVGLQTLREELQAAKGEEANVQ